jgi:DNA-binding transcriptional LysR family regulator
MDRLDELTIFVSIIEAGSLINASRRLRRSPPAVTRALTALEDRMGLRLVERTTRRLAPTEAGTALAERARALLSDYDSMLVGISHAPVRGVPGDGASDEVAHDDAAGAVVLPQWIS